MSTQFHPSLFRAAASVLVSLTVLTAATYFWEGYHGHHWWTGNYVLSLLIPFVVVPCVVCVAWVPSKFEISDAHLKVRFPFRPLRTIPWEDLQYYGWFEGVYGLQFRSERSVTFYTQAFPRHEWRTLKNFLSTTFPDRKASVYIGARLFQWPWKKKRT